MDPLADKLLLVSSFITLGWLNLIPLWLVGVVILRDLVIVGGALVYNFGSNGWMRSPAWRAS